MERATATLGLVLLVGATVLAGCNSAREELPEGPPLAGAQAGTAGGGATAGSGPASAGTGGGSAPGTGGTGGTGGGSVPDGPPVVEPTPPGASGECPPGFHRCGDKCASNTSLTSCGSACDEACPTIQDGVATCDGTRCGISCSSDRRPCLNSCILPGMPCDDSCPTGKNLCNGICVDPTSVTACGPMCTACPMSPNGVTSCDGTKCALRCNDGHYQCEPTQSCNRNEQPCRRDNVDTCPPGHRLCGGKCLVESACCTEGKEGCPECQTCSGMPGRCMNKSDGTGCGSERACRGGTCVQCRTSGSCGSNDACRTGQYQCSAGVESCRESNKPNGTGCGGQNACLNGACRQCRSSGECSDNPCVNSSWQCSGGNERCVEMGPRRGGQRVCDNSNDVCIRGRCQRCRNSGSCTFEFEPECRNASWQCLGEDGGEQCVLSGFRPEGTACGGGGTCDAFGFCIRP
jgi:hypothetical protein